MGRLAAGSQRADDDRVAVAGRRRDGRRGVSLAATMPASYRVEVGAAGGWETVAEIAGNQVLKDKIALHQFAARRADRLRLIIASSIDVKEGVSLRGLEVYSKASPPRPVAEFLARQTPAFVQSRQTLAQWRTQHASDSLDAALLAEEPRTWTPIPSNLYAMKDTGRIVNETVAAHETCLSRLCHQYAQTGRVEYARRAWRFLEALICALRSPPGVSLRRPAVAGRDLSGARV